jgi:hypothetical protein
MNKRPIIKLSVIRKDDAAPCDTCPFGLPIPFGCENAGEAIDKMAPLKIMGPDTSPEESAAIAQANNHLLKWKGSGQCKYAAKIIEGKDAVDCSFETEAAGETGNAAFEGTPWYYKHFSGVGMDGLYSYPLGYFSDNSIDRGMYYGMFSIESISSEDEPDIVKDAEELADSNRK